MKKKLASFEKLERCQIRQECYTRRSNIKFFGIKDNDEESPSDTEETFRRFLTKEMKMTRRDVDNIEFASTVFPQDRIQRNQTQDPSSPKYRFIKTRISLKHT